MEKTLRLFAVQRLNLISLITSGSELFNGVVLPLARAVKYTSQIATPPPAFTYFTCRLQVPVCVMEAPMVVAVDNPRAPSLTLTPWVRLLRHEASIFEPDLPAHERSGRIVAIDFIHASYFGTFLKEVMEPTSYAYATNVLASEDVLLSGGEEFDPSADDET